MDKWPNKLHKRQKIWKPTLQGVKTSNVQQKHWRHTSATKCKQHLSANTSIGN